MKGSFRFGWGMDEVGLGIVVVIILLILVIGLLIDSRIKTRDAMMVYDLALGEMDKSLQVVAAVLQKLPEMVPQFSINENPLSQILQFFQERSSQNAQQQLNSDAATRDDNGRFSHGENDQG